MFRNPTFQQSHITWLLLHLNVPLNVGRHFLVVGFDPFYWFHPINSPHCPLAAPDTPFTEWPKRVILTTEEMQKHVVHI